MKTIVMFITLTLSLSVVSPAPAQIAWETRKVEVDAELGQAEAAAAFAFTNTGDTKVEITSVTTSCGCTTAALDQTVYQPGESGVITGRFAFGDRRGKQTKRIVVRTDHERSPVSTLTMRVTIPEVLRIRPRMVYWRAGESKEPKTIDVTVLHDKPVRLADVQPETRGFTAEVTEREAGKRYTVTITPGDTAAPADVRLRLTTDLAQEQDESFKGFHVLARVLPGSAPTAEPAADRSK